MRNLNELIEKDDPAWPLVEEWIGEATNDITVLPPSDPDRADALVATQVTTRSPMGAIIYETGGLLIDHGWIRVLGSGHARLPRSLPEWNTGRSIEKPGEYPPFLLIADDVIGGFFAVNGGAFGPDQGKVFYFAPDILQWENLEVTYTSFVQWCFDGDLIGFYGEYRWSGWEEEVEVVEGDKGFNIYPPLFTEKLPISERSRRLVPLAELYEMYVKADA